MSITIITTGFGPHANIAGIVTRGFLTSSVTPPGSLAKVLILLNTGETIVTKGEHMNANRYVILLDGRLVKVSADGKTGIVLGF